MENRSPQKDLTTLPFAVDTHSENETRQVAAQIASQLAPGDIVALTGTLGSGKTRFARGVISALQGSSVCFQGSPTFALVQEYSGEPCAVYHFDFYRIKHVKEIYDLGWDEYCSRGGLCLVEWADRFPAVMPARTMWLSFSIDGESTRRIASQAALQMPSCSPRRGRVSGDNDACLRPKKGKNRAKT
jgi:tRNA threonylcarbamoyladenosine biosynthesis protein TsaE